MILATISALRCESALTLQLILLKVSGVIERQTTLLPSPTMIGNKGRLLSNALKRLSCQVLYIQLCMRAEADSLNKLLAYRILI